MALTIGSEHAFATRTNRLRASTIREMLKATQRPDVISFAGGLPAPELFPLAEVEAATHRVLARDGAASLQYSVSEGIPTLREWVAARMCAKGAQVTQDDVLIVGGSQQALDLIGKIYLDPGDTVVVENPTYLGAIQAFDAYEARYLTVETDAHGLVPESLEHALEMERVRPKFLYLTPNFQNPTGVLLAAERRANIVAICERYRLPIFEDDPYGELSFGTPVPPPLLSYQSDCTQLYCGTGSKIIAPGLRIAWLIVRDEAVREKIVPAKQATDLHTSTFAQFVFTELVSDDVFLAGHIAQIRALYAHRRDVMYAAMRADLPAGITYNAPTGSMFFWASMPESIDDEALFAAASRDGILFVPGRAFYPHRDRGNGMRLNFSNAGDDAIRVGIERLARVVREVDG
jgi:2-aminoadipate transaminase